MSATIFKQHMTHQQASGVKIGDRFDHRDDVGRFVLATVMEKHRLTVKLHYEGWSSKWDSTCSFVTQLFRFAEPGSISKRAIHRTEMKHLKIGDMVDVNFKHHPGWRVGTIKRFDPSSGQVQVVYHLPELDTDCQYWTHLDSTEEIDIHGRYTLQRSIVPIWLEARHSLKDTPHHLIPSCSDDIIQNVFGGMKNVMDILINSANGLQLQQITSIIKQKNIKYKESLKQSKPQTNEINENIISSITELSTDSLHHICGYLNRSDIGLFKLTSYKNCMVSLKEMKKYRIGIFNTNQLIDNRYKNYIDLMDLTSIKHMTIDRCISATKYSYLLTLWQRNYHIPNAMQLLFTKNADYSINKYDTEQIMNLSIQEIPNPYFCLLDKRNTILFDKRNARIMNEKDKMNGNKEVVFVKWFDIFFQKIIPLQFMIMDPDNITYDKLIKYIMNEFIATTNEQQKWYSKLVSYLDEMNTTPTQTEKIIVSILTLSPSLIGFKTVKTIKTIDDPLQTLNDLYCQPIELIFQLNPKHEQFRNSKFVTIQEKYDLISK